MQQGRSVFRSNVDSLNAVCEALSAEVEATQRWVSEYNSIGISTNLLERSVSLAVDPLTTLAAATREVLLARTVTAASAAAVIHPRNNPGMFSASSDAPPPPPPPATAVVNTLSTSIAERTLPTPVGEGPAEAAVCPPEAVASL